MTIEQRVKPEVFFIGEAIFDDDYFPGHTVAHVQSVNHPVWGWDRIRTSSVLQKFEDGSFETRNTIYKPMRKEDIDNGELDDFIAN